MKPWKKTGSEIIFDKGGFRIRKDSLVLPNGKAKDWVYWDSRDSVMVAGMTADRKLVMIRQYRYLAGQETLELPSGGLEEGEKPEDGARREFAEESGYRCGRLVKLGSFYETYGQLNRQIHLFFSDEVEKAEQDLDDGERGYEDIAAELVPFDDALRMALDNRLIATPTALIVLLVKEHIGKTSLIDL
ncbi:MAG: NUDIX hydrolase [Nanoarchaeota archaeon]